MKTEPTDLDREAALLFDANCRGIRAYLSGIGWCIISSVRDHFHAKADALDTDDPATVGCMLAQVMVLAKAKNGDVSVSTTGYGEIGGGHGRLNFGISVSVEPPGSVPPRPHQHAHGHIGAALVAAMRSLQAAK